MTKATPLLFALLIQPSTFAACQKADAMWDDKIVASQYGARLPALTAPGLWDVIKLAMPIFTVKALTTEGDELEQGRRKLVHAFGAEARLRLVATGTASDYTGIFRSGAACVIGRFSVASKPTADRFVPGLALKFFIDGDHPSLNLLLMDSIDGQQAHDFFARPFSNIIPAATSSRTRLIAGFFAKAARRFGATDPNPGHLTVEDLAAIETDGSKVAAPRAPYRLLFKPRPAASARFDGATVKDDFRKTLAGFPVGEVLYDVYALEQGATAEQARLLGELVLDSKIVASRYGDEKLYFQHHMAR